MTISTSSLNNFLNYDGSLLAPVIKASIYYNQSGNNVHYEDLYYSHNIAIGCRQYHTLEITSGTAGTIQITNLSNNDQQQGCAAANATLRTYLDLYAQKSPVKNFSVPVQSFDNLMQGLSLYNFQPFEIVPDKPFSATIVMEVVSDPPGQVQYVYYNDEK